jgi:membrane protease YdiL (CAAX protease family)
MTETESPETEHRRREWNGVLQSPLHLALSFFLVSLVFRIIDIFVLNMGDTDFGILPSKIIPIILILGYLHYTKHNASTVGLHTHLLRLSVFLGLVVSLVYVGIDIGGSLVSLSIAGAQPTLSLYTLDYLGYDLVYQTANAFMEEILFRGLMLRCLMTRFTPQRANFLQALCFGLWHLVWPINTLLAGYISLQGAILWSIEYVLSGTIMGFAWGYMFLRTGSLVAPILNHFIINFSSAYVIIEGSASLPPILEMMFPLIGFLAMLVIVAIFTRGERTPRATPWHVPSMVKH